MHPQHPQLPTDAPTAPAPKNLKRGALLLLLVVAVAAALAAFMLPKKQVQGRNAPPATEHRPESPGYDHPTQ